MANKFCIVVKALILNGNKILIIRRGNAEEFRSGEWDLPGGKLSFGESPIESIQRETFEETGLDIEIIKPLDTWTFFRDEEQVIGITFLAKPTSNNISIGKEHTEYKWIHPEEIDKYPVHEGIKKVIKNFK